MSEAIESNVADLLVQLARAPLKTMTVTEGGVPFAVIPSDHKVEDLSKFLYNKTNPTPGRKTGTAKVTDAGSFVEYVNLFRDQESRVFAEQAQGRFLAVLDYHESAEGSPRWGEHRVDLTLQKSREWKLWTASSGSKMTQEDFGRFIEDNQPDILDPSPASMLEMARDLNATSSMEFASQQRVSDGSTVFKFTEQIRGTIGKDETKVFESFTIGIPVYLGSPSHELKARLRFRVNGGKLTFWYDLLRSEVLELEAFAATSAEIAEGLSITIINGSPAA